MGDRARRTFATGLVTLFFINVLLTTSPPSPIHTTSAPRDERASQTVLQNLTHAFIGQGRLHYPDEAALPVVGPTSVSTNASTSSACPSGLMRRQILRTLPSGSMSMV